MANNSLSTNLNTSPYYDDYNEDKDFYRVLFRPSQAVQARELTQMQTITQKQIDRFAEHMFKEGSLVSGGQFIFDALYRYVKLEDNDSLGNPISVSDFMGTEIIGQTTGVMAEVVLTENGTENSTPKTLFIKYKSSGGNGLIKAFAPGEKLVNTNNFEAVIIDDSEAVGRSSIFTIENGVVFAKDHMLRFGRESIVLDAYSDKPSYRVGFEVTESIVDAIDDFTLLDPAQGSYNYSAPGADRLKINLSLIKYPLNSNTSTNFIQLFEIKDGITQEKFERPQYSIIRDELAIRTQDDGGDFYVRGWNVFGREHFNNGQNGGYLTANTGGNSSLLAIGIDPGKGYIKGYDIETLVPRYVAIRKGLDYNVIEQQIVSTNYSNYILVKELVGNWPINSVTQVSLYNTAQTRITSKTYSSGAQTGTLIGTAKLKALKLDSGIKGRADAVYRLYLFDIKITNTSFKFKDVRSVYINNSTTAKAGADIVLEDGIAVIKEPDFNYGVYDIGLKSVKSIRDASNQIDTTYTYDKAFDVSIATNGTFTVNTGSVDEIFSYSTGVLNSVQKNNFYLSLNSDVTIAMGGTVATTASSPQIVGTGTNFTRLNVGDKIQIDTVSGIHRIVSITNDTILNVDSNMSGNTSAKTYTKSYFAGDVIDFNLKGAAGGIVRKIEIISPTSASFEMLETLSSTVTGTVTAKLNRVDAKEIAKVYRQNRYVLIDCATAGTVGPYNLGVSDIYQIKSIRLKSGAFTNVNEGTDVTSLFKLDNGQRDTHYDHASIIKSGAALTNTSQLLVKFDYFQPDFSQGFGYFSVDSYPIDDVSASSNTAIRTEKIPVYVSTTSGKKFDLRNCIDARPIKTNTANDSTVLGTATTNPATTNTYSSAAGGLRTASPDEQFIIDLSYYLPRNDLITVDKNGIFKTIQGVSSTLPITPQVSTDSMTLAVVKVSPYPSLVSQYATEIQRLDLALAIEKKSNRGYTHRDVGVLANRISNLEYYQSLSLLEKNVMDMKISDEDGLDRFKNGIFVDPFNDHSLGDLGNPDYDIAIDPMRKELRPKFRSAAVGNRFVFGTNVVMKNNLVTLPYNQAPLVSQLMATGTRNAAGFFWNFRGSIELSPTSDYWTDTTVAPSIQVTSGPSAQAWQSLADATSSVYGDWNTTWTGVTNTSEEASGGTNVTTTVQSTQSRSKTTVGVMLTTQTENLGDRVIDVGVIPFMRSRSVRFTGRGLQPNTRVYPFFDGENVAIYCYATDVNGIPLGHSTLTTDESGSIYGVFIIPNNEQKRFRVGDRIFKLTDSLLNGSDALTTGQGTYSATGLTQQKQNTFLTTINPTFSSTLETETRTASSSSTTFIEDPPIPPPVITTIVQIVEVPAPTPPPPPVPPSVPAPVPAPAPAPVELELGGPWSGWWTGEPNPLNLSAAQQGIWVASGGDDPIAQTFTVDVIGTSHIFLSSIDLFFQTKHPTLGVWVELREVDSSGNITNKVIPYSRTYVKSGDVVISDNSSLATNIPLTGLVCLTTGQDYAFIVQPEQNNPNYRLFTAKLGEDDLLTGTRVNAQAYSGVFFASSNNKTWSPIQEEDMKFRLNRADFITTNGAFRISNAQREIFKAGTISGTWATSADSIYGETLLTITGIIGATPVVGDKIVQDTTSAEIIAINSGIYRVRGIGAYKLAAGAVSFTNSSDVSTGATGTVTASNTTFCELESKYVNQDDETIFVMANPTGRFVVGERLTRMNGDYVVIDSFTTEKYSVIDFETSSLDFPQTSIKWGYIGMDDNNIHDSNVTNITVSDNLRLNREKIIRGKTEEDNIVNGGSMYFGCELSTVTRFISPLVDLNRTYAIYVKNLISDDATGEDQISGGNCIAKYISQKISLAVDNDAEDLKVFISAYKPAGSEIKIYAKLLNAEDIDGFDNKRWFELSPKSNNTFSNGANDNDYKELEYNIPEFMKTGPLGEVEYVNSAGVEFLGYRNYMVKICLIGSDPAIVPKVKDLRALALQI